MTPRTKTRKLAQRIYGFIAEDEDARVCKEIPDTACHEQPRSFLLQLAALAMTKLGDTLMSPRLVLAWMLSALGAPAVFIGSLVPLRESLALLPQLVVAQFLRGRSVRKTFWVGGALVQAVALCGMLAAVLLFDGVTLGGCVVIALALFSLARGVCSVTAKDVLGKTVSRKRRGRLSGQAAALAGAGTLLVAAGAVVAPGVEGSRLVFAGLLSAAAMLWVLAALLYVAIPEVPGATQGGGNALAEALRSLGLLVRDRHFAAFVRARALLVSSAFAIPYLVVLVQRADDSGATTLGAMLFASGAAGLVSGPLWGRLADRAAHHVMALAAAMTVLVIAAALLLDRVQPAWLASAPVAAVLFLVAAVSHHGSRVGRKTYLVDMANAENRSQYVAVSNTVLGVVLLSGLLLGWLDHAHGAAVVLLLLLVVGVLAAFACRRLPNVSA